MESISLRIEPTGVGKPSLGESYFWDAPQLPSSLEIPMTRDVDGELFPLSFICQINCAEVSKYDVHGLLPDSGFLYFFADIDYFLGYDVPAPEGDIEVAVLYSAAGADELRRVNAFTEDGTIAPHIIKFGPGACAQDGHKLLGCPADSDVLNQMDVAGKEDLVHLFQLDSDESEFFSLQFHDMGYLHFFIDKDDLKEKNFSNIISYLYYY
ncbi:MAG: YwqG family protein [Bacteroidales bacterium]|nr:YwqG family protein [Bacteroidales bacterium]